MSTQPNKTSSHSPSSQAKTLEEMRAEMLQLRCYDHYLDTYDSHVRLDAFLRITPLLDDRTYWSLLREVWTSAEVTLPHKQSWLDLFHARPGRDAFTRPSERRYLQRLPAVVTVYRGCGHVDGIYGMSWTLDCERAKFFAGYSCGPRRACLCPGQRGHWPVLAMATCSKSDIIAYLNDRKEREIVINPSKINLISAKEWRHPERDLRSA